MPHVYMHNTIVEIENLKMSLEGEIRTLETLSSAF